MSFEDCPVPHSRPLEMEAHNERTVTLPTATFCKVLEECKYASESSFKPWVAVKPKVKGECLHPPRKQEAATEQQQCHKANPSIPHPSNPLVSLIRLTSQNHLTQSPAQPNPAPYTKPSVRGGQNSQTQFGPHRIFRHTYL